MTLSTTQASQIAAFLADTRATTVAVETYTGAGAYGPLFDDPVSVLGKVRVVTRMVRNSNGEEVLSQLTVHIGPDDETSFTPQSLVTLGGNPNTDLGENLITNPKAAVDASGWLSDSDVIERVSDWAAEGIATPTLPDGTEVLTGFKLIPSFLLNNVIDYYAGYGYCALIGLSLTEGATANMMVYAPTDPVQTGKYISFTASDEDGSVTSQYDTVYVGQAVGNGDEWAQVQFRLGPDDVSSHVYLWLVNHSTTVARPLYFTAAMVQPGVIGDTYADGDSDDWEWNLDGTSAESATTGRTSTVISAVPKEYNGHVVDVEVACT